MKARSLLLITLAYFLGLMIGRSERFRAPLEPVGVRVDTFIRRDTIRLTEVKWCDRVTLDTVTARVVDTLRDTVTVRLPLEQLVYSDSTYRAWVSGYLPKLDSIEVYRATRYITVDRTVREPAPRWSFGAGVGPSVIYSPFTGHIDAGIGIFGGITYNF